MAPLFNHIGRPSLFLSAILAEGMGRRYRKTYPARCSTCYSPPMATSSLQELLSAVSKQVDLGTELKIVVHKDTGMFKLDRSLVTRTQQMIRETNDALLNVIDTFEESPPEASSTSTLSSQEVADLAFVCRSELKELGKAFDVAVNDGSLWKIAAANDAVVSRAVRALIPIETTLREYGGLPSLLRQWFDLDDALEIRRRFAEFWILLHKDGEPTDDTVGPLLNQVSRHIALLRRDSIYPFLRIDDRLEIRAIQKRIFRHLEDSSASPLEGRRIYHDILGFFDLLLHRHQREELAENDRFLVDSIIREVFDQGSVPPLFPEESFEDVSSFVSMDPELDRLILLGQPSESIHFLEPLRRIRDQLKGK